MDRYDSMSVEELLGLSAGKKAERITDGCFINVFAYDSNPIIRRYVAHHGGCVRRIAF